MIAALMRKLAGGVFVPLMLGAVLHAPQVAAEGLDYGLLPRKIADDTWVLIGKTEDFSRSNGGNIVNTAFVVTAEGVVVIDSGPSRLYAEQMRRAIARITPKPVIRVFNTHHHPDHFLGNQVFADVPTAALASTITGQRQEGAAFTDNVYRLSGDWIKGTESTPAREAVGPGVSVIGNHEFELIALSGHTDGDLVILDRSTGVLFAGDLVFYNRAPTTPHATVGQWFAALDRLDAISYRTMVPGHGDPVGDGRAVRQTRSYLRWVESTLRQAAERGDEMAEVLGLPVPAEFAAIPLSREEFARSVAHLYRRYEAATLSSSR
jgi:quinoprotein relay system zinc metallohydrolase 1